MNFTTTGSRAARAAAATAAFALAAVGLVLGVDAIPSSLRPELAGLSVLYVEPDATDAPVRASGAGTTVPVVESDPVPDRPSSVIVVIPDDADPVVVDPSTVSSTSTSRSTSTSDADVGVPTPTTAPDAATDRRPPGKFDVDGNVFVDDPDGQLAELRAAAASATASAAAAGIDARSSARAGTAIDDDNDVAAAAQGYAGANASNDAAAIAVAVAAAADNNAMVGEPEVEAEAEIELPDDSIGMIEIYADVAVIVISDDVSGYEDGSSLVIETAIVIVRNHEVIIVYADGTTGRVNGSSRTTGTVVDYEHTYTIDEAESILGEGGDLPTAVANRLLEGLSRPATTEPAPAAPDTGARSWDDIDTVLDEFVDEMISAVSDSDPATPVTFDDSQADPAADRNSSPPGGPTRGTPSGDESSAEAEAEAEAEADASQSGAASAAGASSTSAAAVDTEGQADATADAVADGEVEAAAGAVEAESESASESESETESDGSAPDENEAPATSTSNEVSTEAEAGNGDDTVTEASDGDGIDLEPALEAVADPVAPAAP